MAGRVLVVDDVTTNRVLMAELLERKYYDVEEARNAREALQKARANPPDIAIVDVMMPGMNGYDLCREMKRDPLLADVPIVICTTLDTRDERRAGIEAGADDFLTKPVRPVSLFARIRSLLRMKAMTDELRLRDETLRDLAMEGFSPSALEPPPGAHIVGLTSAAGAGPLKDMLEARLDVRVEIVCEPRDTFRLLEASAPEAVLVDALGFPGFSSDFCSAVRQQSGGRHAALLTIVDVDDAATAAACLDAGANDYVMAPVDPSELAARLRTQLRYKAYADFLRESVRDGLKQAVTDPLTGLRNRRYLDAHLPRLVSRAREHRQALAVLAFDLDRFKAVNDTFGHAAGDAVLREFARRLTDNIRTVDLAARLGGEEFVVALPDATLETARIAGERVRAAVEAPGFAHEGRPIPVTVSVGVAGLHGPEDDATAMLARADAALYQAKQTGRNRVILEAA
ncbi:MAG: diguanylate cyclase [Rhodobacteraceae bacterium]|nr:MAG: diguanylate cyclase [Paracoccaceae bacterium]